MYNLDWLRIFVFLGGFVFFVLFSFEVEVLDFVIVLVKYCFFGSVVV